MMKVIFLFWLFLGVVFSGQLSSLQAEEVELTNASGTVEVYLKDSDGYAPAEEGMKLEAGDQIRTGSSSSAEISFNQNNANLIRLGENTVTEVTLTEDEKMNITEGGAPESQARGNLEKGRLKIEI